MENNKIIVVCAGGIDAVKPEILLELEKKYGANGFVVIEPKDLKKHVVEEPIHVFTRPVPFDCAKELLREPRLKDPAKPIDAILKNKRYK